MMLGFLVITVQWDLNPFIKWDQLNLLTDPSKVTKDDNKTRGN